MKFALVVHLDNDAFQPEPGPELDRILRNAADRASVGVLESNLLDSNGNRVGATYIMEEEN